MTEKRVVTKGGVADLPRAATLGSVVSVKGVQKTFDVAGGGRTVALQDIDLEIRHREFVSLIGPSGCGKSTLLRLIGDLITPSGGTVVVNGKPAPRARQDRDYGMVFQAPVLFDWRTVEANVRLPLEVMRYSAEERRRRAREMLELVELREFLNHYPYQLSGGMQQRVAIARALAFQPALLLMDEPFGALDEMTRERMNSELLRIWESTGTTIVFVTHSIPEAVFLSSRVVVMSARPGRITNIVDIDLPRPRNEETRESERYFELVTEVRESLRGRIGSGRRDDRHDPMWARSGKQGSPSARTSAEGPVG
jgi:NitT/TauT family transport system ATP-binding protein